MTFKSTLLVFLTLILIPLSFFAQALPEAAPTAKQTQAEAPKEAAKAVPGKVPDNLKSLATDIQIIALKRAINQRDYQLGVQKLSQLQQDFTDQSNQLNAKVDELYKKLDLKKEEWDINFETGDISPIPPQKK